MSWRAVTEDDVIASMSVAELDQYKNSANWDSDPVQILMRRTVAFVRDQLRTNGNVKLSPDETMLPEGCIGYAVDLLVFDICKRLGGSMTEERKAAQEAATKYFERISRRWVTVESWNAPQTDPSAGAAIQIVKESHHRLTPENLENM